MADQTLYEAVGGWEGVLRLAHAWHEAVLADPVVSHAFSHGYRPDHTTRLAAYWAEAWGGPPDFTERYGNESSVVRIHSGNGVHKEMDRRAIACFDRALETAGVTDARLSKALSEYFAWATTRSMAAYPHSKDQVPDDLDLPRWTSEGPATR